MCFPLVFVFSFHLDTCSCQFSAFSSILWSFPQFATPLARFRVAVSQFHMFLQLFFLFLCFAIRFTILRFCGLFLWISYMLLSFHYISCSFNYADLRGLMFWFDFMAFWFRLVVCCFIRHDIKIGKPDSQCPPGLFPRCIFHNCFRMFPRLFTMFTSFHFIFQHWFAIISMVHCALSFSQANLKTN